MHNFLSALNTSRCAFFLLFLVFSLSACSSTATREPAVSQPAWTYGGMVSVANPYAAQAAADVLASGGHAVDAAIAAHTVLGLVEPQSSGIGGGGFMLVYERASGRLVAYDGRETAPGGATADMFMAGHDAMPFLQAWQSGLAVGVPGAIALYEHAHARHGHLTMAENVAAAVTLAEEGFVVSPRLAGMLEAIAGPS